MMNRLNRDAFLKARDKIALMPTCRLHTEKFQSSETNQLYFGLSSSQTCFPDHIAKLMLDFGIRTYFWLSSSLKAVLHLMESNRKRYALIGIASLPELYQGMQKCMKMGVPVLGIPLNSDDFPDLSEQMDESTLYLEVVERLIAS